MGGVLSGRRGWRGGKRPTTALPAVRLTHAETFSLKYRPAYVRIEADDFGTVVHGFREWFVRIEHTRPNYGGTRRWLVCPCCKSRRLVLYIDGDVLACRVCLGLRYESSHENRRELAMRKADRIRNGLGWQPGILNPNGKKPKGMHSRTYERQFAALEVLTNAFLPNLNDWVDRLDKSLGRRKRRETRRTSAREEKKKYSP